MKPKTYHDGAADERKAILAKLRREARFYHDTSTTRHAFEYLIDWLLQRNERYEKRPGGLGRKTRKG